MVGGAGGGIVEAKSDPDSDGLDALIDRGFVFALTFALSMRPTLIDFVVLAVVAFFMACFMAMGCVFIGHAFVMLDLLFRVDLLFMTGLIFIAEDFAMTDRDVERQGDDMFEQNLI